MLQFVLFVYYFHTIICYENLIINNQLTILCKSVKMLVGKEL